MSFPLPTGAPLGGPPGGPNGAGHDQWWAAMLAAAPAHMLHQAMSIAQTGCATALPAVDVCTQRVHPLQQDRGSSSMLPPRSVPVHATAPQTKLPSPTPDDGPDEEDCSSNGGNHGASPTEQATTADAFEQPEETVREQDRFLPIANVAKVMTRQLSSYGHAKIAHDAKMAMQETVTEVICFIMSEANDQAVRDKRKTVTGLDIANTTRAMDLRGFYEPLSLALEFLQPVKRRRGKSSEDDPGGKKRRRCRVSDEEYERLRLAKMAHHQPCHQPAFPLLPAKDDAVRPTRGVVIASPAVQFAVHHQQLNDARSSVGNAAPQRAVPSSVVEPSQPWICPAC